MTTRREFLTVSGGCVAHVLLMSACARAATRMAWTAPANPTVTTAPFARLDAIAADTWALVSTPLGGDRTTFSNGGIIAGRDGVIAVEGFYKPAGATWLAEQARALTGRWPTHVVLTHYHSDHAAGVDGYKSTSASTRTPTLRATATTKEWALSGGPVAPTKDDGLVRAFADVVIVNADKPGVIDLGNRKISLVSLMGHTKSDIALVDDDANITFAGDLLWNGMFPNFVDATPTRLIASMSTLATRTKHAFVPGHGAMANHAAVQRYLDLLNDLGASAKRGHDAGKSAQDVAAAYTVPVALGEWMASKTGLERAMTAWYREWTPAK